MAVLRKDRRLVVAQVAKAVGGALAAAHRGDQPGNFPRAATHQRALERGDAHAVEHARGDAHDVFGCRADLVADEVRAVVKPDQPAGEQADQPLLDRLAVRVDDHAVGHAGQKLLHMARSQPDGHAAGLAQRVARDLGQAAAGAHLDALHAQHERLLRHLIPRQLHHQLRQALRADGDADHLRAHRLIEVAGQVHVRAEGHQPVAVRLHELRHVCRALAPVECDLVPDMVQIPRDKRSPPAAADHRHFHRLSPFPSLAALYHKCPPRANRLRLTHQPWVYAVRKAASGPRRTRPRAVPKPPHSPAPAARREGDFFLCVSSNGWHTAQPVFKFLLPFRTAPVSIAGCIFSGIFGLLTRETEESRKRSFPFSDAPPAFIAHRVRQAPVPLTPLRAV